MIQITFVHILFDTIKLSQLKTNRKKVGKLLKRSQERSIDQVFGILATVAALALMAIGGLAWWAHSFTTDMVQGELAAQKIYFPEAGSKALNAEEYPQLQKYGGQLVDTAEEAKAYANDFIGSHLKKIAGGKVYSEISAEAQKDPTNETLQKQKQTLFQGETLRGMLLANGYGFGTVGKIAQIAAYVAFAASGIMILLALTLAKSVYGSKK